MAPKIDDKIYETTGKDCNRPGRRPYTNIQTNKQQEQQSKSKTLVAFMPTPMVK
jgi:hypothetical protein